MNSILTWWPRLREEWQFFILFQGTRKFQLRLTLIQELPTSDKQRMGCMSGWPCWPWFLENVNQLWNTFSIFQPQKHLYQSINHHAFIFDLWGMGLGPSLALGDFSVINEKMKFEVLGNKLKSLKVAKWRKDELRMNDEGWWFQAVEGFWLQAWWLRLRGGGCW